MKKVLVACDPPKIDMALQNSLVHLAKSCQLDVVPDGYDAFEKMSIQIYDLIIIDAGLSGINSIELIESVHYIDPGLPVILMLEAEQKLVRTDKSLYKVRTVELPIKPIPFLRLIDKVLHQQLNRYRKLASDLTTIIDALQAQNDGPCAFLVEDSGQILITSGEVAEENLDHLSEIVVNPEASAGLVNSDSPQPKAISQQQQETHNLYLVSVTENLRLALLSPPILNPQQAKAIWDLIDTAALDIIVAFHNYNQTVSANHNQIDLDNIMPQERALIPAEPALVALVKAPPLKSEDEDEQDFVNWGLLSNTPKIDQTASDQTPNEAPEQWDPLADTALLQRLGNFCRVE